MTLQDVFKPNKFGTVPLLVLPSLGHVVKDYEQYARVSIDSVADGLISLEESVKVTDNKWVNIEHPWTTGYEFNIEYLLPLTPDYYLIHNAIEPVSTIWVLSSEITKKIKFTSDLLERLQPDGSCWFQGEPVTIYVQDILYRLDLQDKLT